MDGGRFVRAIAGKPLPAKPAYCIHEDPRGDVWIGTRAGLLAIAPNGAQRLLTTGEGLPGNRIVQIQQDGEGDFWLAGMLGIFRVSRSDLYRGRVGEVALMGISDGMKSREVTYGTQPTSSASADGRTIWFPTVRGAARLDPAAVRRSSAQLTPRIEEVVVDGRSYPPDA